jgi:class 3 adenylate cyclase/predicted ATPase
MDSVKRTTAWLQELGLGNYGAAFAANNIELSGATRLSEADLTRIGVASPADRQLLLRAIAELPPPKPMTQAARERRLLTVMFCDLVGSTSFSSQLDPEDLASVIDSYQQCCADAVVHFGGFIARYVGDGVLAYFGYPQAREGDAERATRAALRIIETLGQLALIPNKRLQARIGIATGPTVVGDTMFEQHAAVGETPNLAARLQSVATPDGIIIADTTYRLVAPVFNCTQLPPLELKGLQQPVQAWRVAGDRRQFDRFRVRRAAGLAQFVGREGEIGALLSRWRSAVEADGQAVLISGEAGIGKSRLIEELESRASGESHLRVDFSGSPFFTNTPLFPVIAYLERAGGLLPNDPVAERRQKIDQFIAQTWQNSPAGAARILASLLSLPAQPDDPPLEPDPAQRKEQTFRLLASYLEAQAERQPLLLVGEDLHWFDPTTVEFLGQLIDKLQGRRCLTVLTCRSEFPAPWQASDKITVMPLQRLDQGASGHLVGNIAGGRELPLELREKIVERSDGVPLFVEELTKLMLDRGGRGAAGTIPETLQDSLVARIDRLPAGKEVLQIGAAIGREFQEDLLGAVAQIPPRELGDKLELLVSGNLLERHASPSGATYVYRHALVQDAAYETMLFARRRDIHKRIAVALETRFSLQWQNRPELLAYHRERAGEVRAAADLWKLAGTRAAERSAATEAAAHLRHALAILQEIPPGRGRDILELELNAQLGAVLRAVQGPAGLDTGAAFGHAKDLCRRTGDVTLLAPALAGLYGYHLVRAENEEAGATARELLSLAESRGDRLYQMIGHRAVGAVLVHTGRLSEAREHLERSLGLYDPVQDGPLAFVYGTDHAQTASSFLAFALHLTGRHQEAGSREAWAVCHGEQVGHLYSRVQTLAFRTMMRVLTRQWDTASAMAEEALALAEGRSFALAKAALAFFASACRAAREPSSVAAEELQNAAEAWWQTGALNYRPFHLALVAEAFGSAGDHARALETLSRARRHIAETNERWIEPEIHRLRGEFELLRDRTRVEDAEGAFRTAIAIARQQGSKMLGDRATASLAELTDSGMS